LVALKHLRGAAVAVIAVAFIVVAARSRSS